MGNISSAVVVRWLAAGDAGDVDAFDDLLHPDAVTIAFAKSRAAALASRLVDTRMGLTPPMPTLNATEPSG